MLLMATCSALAVVGVVGVVRWGALDLRPPLATRGRGDVARCFLWHVTVGVVAGLGAGLLIAGAGGRLVMRLLAVTSPAHAQGRITEADEVIGEITTGGTIGFIVFTGLFFGLASGALYVLLRRWLPGGRAGGLAFGGLLLVVAGSRIEPLRANNPDFDLVGPAWVSLVSFAVLIVAHGGLVAAIAARYASGLPLLSREPKALAGHAPLLLLVPLVVPAVAVALVGLIVVGLSEMKPVVAVGRRPDVTIIGRVVLAVGVMIALPGFVGAVADIARRGP